MKRLRRLRRPRRPERALARVLALHRPRMSTLYGVDVCDECTKLRQVHIIRHPCPTYRAMTQER